VKLILVGVRGSGKTTVGSMAAEEIGAGFIDMDTEIEAVAGNKISDIFAGTGGESKFRSLESLVLLRIADMNPPEKDLIISTGGGIVIERRNRKILRRMGHVVWLQVSADQAVSRTAGSDRPSLTGLYPLDEAKKMISSRWNLYESIADSVVVTDARTIQDVCNEIVTIWHELNPAEFKSGR